MASLQQTLKSAPDDVILTGYFRWEGYSLRRFYRAEVKRRGLLVLE